MIYPTEHYEILILLLAVITYDTVHILDNLISSRIVQTLWHIMIFLASTVCYDFKRDEIYDLHEIRSCPGFRPSFT